MRLKRMWRPKEMPISKERREGDSERLRETIEAMETNGYALQHRNKESKGQLETEGDHGD